LKIYWDSRRKANGIPPNTWALDHEDDDDEEEEEIPKQNAASYRAMLKKKLHHSVLSHIHSHTVNSCIAVLQYV
jgi:hypothetical protein